MFFRTERLSEQIKKEDQQLASILESINQLYRITNFKLAYVSRLLRNYNITSFFYDREKYEKFMKTNNQILEKLEELIKSEDKIKSD